LELLHTDVGGPITPVSLGGARYYVTFTDDYSRATWIYFMKTKGECLGKMQELVKLLHTDTGLKVKRIRSDNGGEYSSAACKAFYKKKGIKWEPTVPYAPEQDGVAERVNRTILDRLRAIIADTGLRKDLWAEALSTVVYLKNRSPTTANKDSKTPFEIWYGRKPALGHLREVGCQAYYHLPKTGQKKLDPRGQKAVFIGYEG
jgi:transposase InsO family protein